MRHLEYTTLFRTLAERHLQVQHRPDQVRFVRLILSSDPLQKVMDFEEFYGGLKHKIDLRDGSACLVLENYQADYSDNDGDFTGKEHHGAFLILRPVKAGDYDQRDAVIDACEAIGEDIMAAAIAQLRARERPVRISPGDVLAEAVGPVGSHFYGARFNFSFRSPATPELCYDPTKFSS
ncbi:hypothetical protein [Hymenobacter rubidus]|uniref:hypothetical protein n=1 Tax=Hymenobacter rubidus TaxID=1441626 RepID=UPI00191F0579|nr:hypothetical protein [Hymenobacter rubidus]